VSGSVQLEFLGPDPTYRRYFFEVRIDTPWWLPDVTFRWHRLKGEPAPEQMDALTTPLISASAFQTEAAEPVELTAISPVVGTEIRPDTVYNIEDLAGASGAIPQAAFDALPPIAVDSVLSMVFNASVEDLLVFGQNTPTAVGEDESGEVSTRYELVEFGIRRKPRHSASGWTFLLDPALSRMETLDNLTPDEVAERTRQRVRMRWDADFQRVGKLDPRRLLINSDTPFLQTVLNFEADEALIRNEPGWPCCPSGPEEPVWHALDFREVTPGARVPAVQYFSDSQSTLHWRGVLPPIVGVGQAAGGEPRVARLNADVPPEDVFARLCFDEPARLIELRMLWKPFHLNRALTLRVFLGLDEAAKQSFDLSNVPPVPILFDIPEGCTEILLALDGAPLPASDTDFGWIEWVSARYRTVNEVLVDGLRDGRCSGGEDTARPGGRFAWLPNHDYEIQLKTRVTIRHEGAGALVREAPQTLRFQTKGLPGLNRKEREGAEFEPYVEAEYPRPRRPLYRDEAVRLALNEKSDIFRPPVPPRLDDPPERRQQADWALVVRRVGGAGPPERVSQPGPDWIVSHRGTAPTPGTGPGRRPIDVGLVASRALRAAPSLDPLWIRFDQVRASPYSCAATPSEPPSRVLSHAPHDPDPGVAAGRWPARALLRAAVQLRSPAGADPFVERAPFAAGDETALTVTLGAWDVQDSRAGPAADTGAALSLAVLGEAAWRHVRANLLVDPAGGAAGAALAVGGSPLGSDAILFLVDEGAGELRALRRRAGAETPLASAPLAGLAAPFRLEVAAHDDAFAASVGEARLVIDREPANQGRLALAVRGSGRVHELRVDPLDLYSFDFETSRFADFAAHVGSWTGALARLPSSGPQLRPIADLLSETPVADLMASGSASDLRQDAFDAWSAALGVFLRTASEGLEISVGGADGGADFLLLESPEPLPFTEDVALTLRRADRCPPRHPQRRRGTQKPPRPARRRRSPDAARARPLRDRLAPPPPALPRGVGRRRGPVRAGGAQRLQPRRRAVTVQRAVVRSGF